MTPFPLKRGQRGEPIRDLQRRLGAAGYSPDGAEASSFCASTEAALTQFQEARGLHADGVCDEQSWLAIVEAGWNLGDRLLVLSAPQLRGDDVEDLQRALNHVGFDCGRPDGILGPATIRALVDFWAEWCGPCKQIAPILEEIVAEHGENIAITKLNVDDNPDLAMKYNVMSIPTLLVFKGGEVEKRLVGAKSKGALLQELEEFLPTT